MQQDRECKHLAHVRLESFFFFQAEDGIRDDLVTGVQTCALPISHPVMAGMPDKAAVFVDGSPVFEAQDGFKGTVLARYQDTGSPLLSGYLIGEEYRSEERRVGKECRSRWSPYH